MALDLSIQVPMGALSSLLEVGVGTNLALVLIDGTKGYLTKFGKLFITRVDDVVNDFMSVLEESTEAARQGVSSIQRWSRFTVAAKNFVTSELLFLLLKSLCIIVAICFVILLGFSPFVSPQLGFWWVVSLIGFAVFPLLLAAIHFLIAVLFSGVFYSGAVYLKWRHKFLLDHCNELARRSILPVDGLKKQSGGNDGGE